MQVHQKSTSISEIQIERRVLEEIAVCGNIDTDAIWNTLDMQLEKLCEGKIINIKENGCEKRIKIF